MSQYTTRAVVQAETVLVEPIVSVAMDGADGYTPGLLPSTVASGPIEVTIPWNVELVEEDKLQLYWDGRPVGVVHTITGQEEADGQDLKLTLPLSAADNNNWGPKTPHVLRYHLDPFYTDVNVFSSPINIYVDRTAPGGGLLGELEIPSIEPNYVVTPDKLDSSGRLVARVPSYGGQYEGDEITLLTSRDNVNWDAVAGANVKLPPGASENTDVTVYFPLAALLALADGQRWLGYEIVDRAGNRSTVRAVGRPVTLLLNDVPADSDLFKPVIPLHADGIITDADARQLTVLVPKFAHAHVDDRVVMFFGGISLGELPVTDINAEPILTFQVPYAVVAQAAGPTHQKNDIEVYYTVSRMGHALATSPLLENVRVDLRLPGGPDPDPLTPIHELLIDPWIIGENGIDRNIIYANQYGKDANITVPWPAGAAAPTWLFQDVVQVTFGSLDLPPYPINASDVTDKKDLVFTLTGTQMETEGAGDQPLKYTVTRRFPAAGSVPGYSNTAASRVVTVHVIGGNDVPGGGTNLPNGEFVNLNPQGALDWANTRNGVQYRIWLNYANVRDQDHIFVKFVGYYPRRGTAPVVGNTYEANAVISTQDINRGSYIFTIPSSHFTNDLFPRLTGFGHGHYIVNNQGGTGNAPEVAPANRVTVDLLHTDTPPDAASMSGIAGNSVLDNGRYTQLKERLGSGGIPQS
ncbi:hypothetical protein [Pseudomonas coleopterorum]|jgi:hypothetical protein|uniref:Uncharacterized protein n=1 Tax=Pseudomonas coleopterorum TaxID=1605838 RepID=A0AAJ6M160_9PSED|nr:hypothetical protein [Pseudomonas coleopterorum]WNC10280.1 hypothetical protein RI108_02265 [Pseudomonas coleopterorum]